MSCAEQLAVLLKGRQGGLLKHTNSSIGHLGGLTERVRK